jgi:hypothetical protein
MYRFCDRPQALGGVGWDCDKLQVTDCHAAVVGSHLFLGQWKLRVH